MTLGYQAFSRRKSAIRATKLLCSGSMLLVSIIGAAGVANAQSLDDGQSDNGSANEIIVTAQKREQSIRDVGLAITAVTGDALESQGIDGLDDFSRIEPSFSAEKSLSGSPTYTIRGIGYHDFALAAVPAVAIYSDEAPFAFSSMTKGVAMDLERVEILKGPQGTLFGQSSTGGAVNFIAARPTDSFEAGLQASYARFNEAIIDAYVSGPLADTLSGRLAVHTNTGGAWQKSTSRDDSLGEQRFWSARALLDFQPTDALSLRLDVNGWQDNSDTQAGQFIAFPAPGNSQVFAPDVYAVLSVTPFTPEQPRLAEWDPGVNYRYNEDFLRVTLRGDYDLNDELTLSSISAYSDYSNKSLYGNDGVAITNWSQRADGTIRSYFQEIRLAGAFEQLNWLVGGNYSRDNVEDNGYVIAPDSWPFAFYSFLTGGAAPVLNDLRNHTHSEITTWAGFANLEYELMPTLTAIGGIRYTHTTTNFEGCTADSGDGRLATGTNLSFGTNVQPGGCVTLNPVTFNPELYTTEFSEDNVSWKVGLNWNPTPNILVFAFTARGYKAHSFTNSFALASVTYTPAVQERLQDYEIGIKSSWLDDRLFIDATYFHYDYKNKQVNGNVPEPIIFGAVPGLVSIPKSRVDGAELTIEARPVPGLSLRAAGSWVDSKVTDDYINVERVDGSLFNFKGMPFPYTPEWSYVLSGNYEFDISSDVTGTLGGDYTWRDDTRSNFGFLAIDNIDSYGLLSLRAGIQAPDRSWFAEIWGTNVTNEYYWQDSGFIQDTAYRRTGKPAIYGFRIGHEW